MKKIWIILALCIITFIALPFIGNRVVQNEITKTKQNLSFYGFELLTNSINSEYLTTKASYTLSIKDGEKFIEFINSISQANIPNDEDMKDAFKGMKFIVDTEYSNLAIDDNIKTDISLKSLPTNMMLDLQDENLALYTYLTKFFDNKKLLYHIEYNVAKNTYKGYLKDIDETYTTQDNEKITLKILKSTFDAKGNLFKPKNLNSATDTISLDVDADEKLNLTFKNISSIIKHNATDVYASKTNFKEIIFNSKNEHQKEPVTLKLDNLKVNTSMDISKPKGLITTLINFSDIEINATKAFSLKAKGFNYDLAFSDLDKESFDLLKEIIASSNTRLSTQQQKQIQDITIKFLSKGLSLAISDLSLKKLKLNNTKEIDGFKINAKASLKQNPNLKTDIKTNPQVMSQSVNVNAHFKFSQEFFGLINNQFRISQNFRQLAKNENKSLIYNVEFKDEILSINGKRMN